MYHQAMRAAAGPLPAGPFRGVPFLLKDLHAALEGEPLTGGSISTRDHRPDYDSHLVARYKAAGLIMLGKTNTPELGLAPVTEPELHGPTRNPWDLRLSPGGSSGGSAAAVAAGIVPAAHASDGGGSIRIPASACGLFGLKPTRGRNPLGPEAGELWFGLTQEHVISRSVRDSAVLLDATNGNEAGDPYAAPPVERPYREEVGADPGKLRIAYTTDPLLGDSIHPDCVAAVDDAVALLTDLGHEVEEAAPPVDRKALIDAFVTLVAASTAHDIDRHAGITGNRPHRSQYEDITWVLGLVGRKLGADRVASALTTIRSAGRVLGTFHTRYDVLVTATLGTPPLAIGALRPKRADELAIEAVIRAPLARLLRGLVDRMAGEILAPIPNTPLFNMTGQPAMSVPLYWNGAGLPIGVQLAGRFGDEGMLFRLAGQLEQARPWAGRRPDLAQLK